MRPEYFSAMWPAITPALGNHLWQSTLFAVVAGLLTLILRKNHAGARYWIWLAASVKFLVPFSWLVAIGGRLSWSRGSAGAMDGLYYAMDEISQPFTQPAGSVNYSAAGTAVSSNVTHLFPGIVAGVWLCGFVGVVAMWCICWWKISRQMQRAVPLRQGREVETLRRLEQVAGTPQRVELLLSQTTLEPGIFGVRRPVLLWPKGISDHLDDAHLEAVLAHELWHVRRRDNLAAAIHMLVEAMFWFHPLVWWVGARLVDERERACDEEVLESGSERHVYAESILKVCEFCVGSPLACVSGVTGSDLKKRMVHIMSEGKVRKLDFGRKILLTAAALVTFATPVTIGLLTATPGRAQSQVESSEPGATFASVSIKPSVINTPTYAGGNVHMVRMMVGPAGFSARNVTMRSLIQEAYGVQANQVLGGPEWLDRAAFDIEAKTGQPESMENSGDKASFEKGAAVNHQMLEKFLADRAKLTLHKETKVLPSYELVVAENGSKLQPSLPASSDKVENGAGRPMGARQMMMNMDENKVRAIAAHEVTTDEIAQQLSRQLGIHVANQTGLKGNYDFNLHWMDGKGAVGGESDTAAIDAKGPSLFTALQQQLGLKLEPKDRPTEVLVVDHVEKPADE